MLSVLALARLSTLALLTPSDELANDGAARRGGRWVENWPNGQAQQVVVSGTKSSWRTDTSQELIREPKSSKLFVDDLEDAQSVPLALGW